MSRKPTREKPVNMPVEEDPVYMDDRVGGDCKVFVISDDIELAVPEACPQVVLGCPETREEVVIPYGELQRLIETLVEVAKKVGVLQDDRAAGDEGGPSA